MTPQRAQQIADMAMRRPQHEWPYSYRPPCDYSDRPLIENGLTCEEHDQIMAVWETMPSNTSAWDALRKIAAQPSPARPTGGSERMKK